MRFLAALLLFPVALFAATESVSIDTKTKKVQNPIVNFGSGNTLDATGATLIGFPGGSGSVFVSGTPLLDQVAIWTDASHIKGVTAITGGSTGQVLQKVSGTDYDYHWATVTQPTPTATATSTPTNTPTPTATATATPTSTATATPTATATATPTATAVSLTIDGVTQQINTNRIWESYQKVTFDINGVGIVIAAGTKLPGASPLVAGGTLIGWKMTCTPSGNVSVDLLRSTSGDPVVSMVGSGTKPAISSNTEAHGTITDWTTSMVLTANDRLAVTLSGINSVTHVVITFYWQ